MNIEIRPLTKDLIDDYLFFFDNIEGRGLLKRFLTELLRIIQIKTTITLKRIQEKENYPAQEISKDRWNYIKDTISR